MLIYPTNVLARARAPARARSCVCVCVCVCVEDNTKPVSQTKLFLYSNVYNFHVATGCFSPVCFVSICNIIPLNDETATEVCRQPRFS